MLIKLLKYDIKSNYKAQLALCVSMLCLMIVSLLVSILHSNVLNSILMFIGVLVSVGVLVGYAVFHITGFNNSMVGRDCYLTHTIPVSMNKIIFSKFVSAVFWAAVCVASICLFWFVTFKTVADVSLTEEFSGMLGVVVLMIVGQFICMITMVAFSIGLSAHPKYSGAGSRTLTSVIVFIILYYLCAATQLGVIGTALFINGDLSALLSNEMNDAHAIEIVRYVFVYIFAVYMVLSAMFYTFSVKIFSKHKSL